MSERHATFSPAEIDRFWQRVRKGGPNECWIWTGGKNRSGYGRFCRMGAHRYALGIESKSVPVPEIFALHSCDNPPCVNPAHLRWGTVQDNVRDMCERGRSMKWNGRRRYDGNPRAKMTAIHVLLLRSAFKLNQSEVARRLGLDTTTVSNVILGKTWKGLSL